MQSSGKVNNTTIWWLRKTDEMNHFKVKIWRGFNLTIFKVNTSTIRELKFLQSDLTLNLLLPPVVTYWYDHVQALNAQTPLLGFIATQVSLLVTLRFHSKVLDYLYLLIFVAATSTTPDLEILQGIFLIEDFREFWVQKPYFYDIRSIKKFPWSIEKFF